MFCYNEAYWRCLPPFCVTNKVTLAACTTASRSFTTTTYYFQYSSGTSSVTGRRAVAIGQSHLAPNYDQLHSIGMECQSFQYLIGTPITEQMPTAVCLDGKTTSSVRFMFWDQTYPHDLRMQSSLSAKTKCRSTFWYPISCFSLLFICLPIRICQFDCGGYRLFPNRDAEGQCLEQNDLPSSHKDSSFQNLDAAKVKMCKSFQVMAQKNSNLSISMGFFATATVIWAHGLTAADTVAATYNIGKKSA